MTLTTTQFKLTVCLSVAETVILLDQISKWFAATLLAPAGQKPDIVAWLFTVPQEKIPFAQIEVLPFFNLVAVWNHGISFGLMQGAAPLVMIGIALLITLAVFGWFLKSENRVLLVGQVLVIAGALGNIWDRVRFGAVFDFLDFHIFNWHYPAFNVADSAIVLGVGAIAFYSLVLEKKGTTPA